MATRYIMVHEAIKQTQKKLEQELTRLPLNGSRTDTKTMNKVLKTVQDAEYKLTRKCNVLIHWRSVRICGRRVELSEVRVMLPYEKRGGFSTSQLEEIFGTSDFDDILDNHTAQEAVAKIAEWEKMREVQVGDVVRDLFKDRTAVVSYVYNYDSKCYVIFGDGSGGKYEKKDFVKTGRTIDITALLAQIGGVE